MKNNIWMIFDYLTKLSYLYLHLIPPPDCHLRPLDLCHDIGCGIKKVDSRLSSAA